ncbi:MAG: three-Cys-motif partner protein TcmP [Parvularculales bacterium]
MSDEQFVPEVGPWAKEKLECLGKYLAAYTTILRKQKKFKGYVYIDAFAGSGKARIRERRNTDDSEIPFFSDLQQIEEDAEQEKFIEGSPRVALGLPHPFTRYVFVELSEKQRRKLKELKQEHSDKKIRIDDRDCSEYLLWMLSQKVKWEEWRGVVFLDPFGADVPWETVNALGRTKSFEVFINFPWMAITRLANNDGDIPEGHREILDRYFGSEKWFDVMYNQQQNLFGEAIYTKEQDAAKALVNWYRERLKTTFGHASAARLIKNTKNSPLYYLIWAGPNPTGREIANYILSQGDKI